jgi:hypothetical protein
MPAMNRLNVVKACQSPCSICKGFSDAVQRHLILNRVSASSADVSRSRHRSGTKCFVLAGTARYPVVKQIVRGCSGDCKTELVRASALPQSWIRGSADAGSFRFGSKCRGSWRSSATIPVQRHSICRATAAMLPRPCYLPQHWPAPSGLAPVRCVDFSPSRLLIRRALWRIKVQHHG